MSTTQSIAVFNLEQARSSLFWTVARFRQTLLVFTFTASLGCSYENESLRLSEQYFFLIHSNPRAGETGVHRNQPIQLTFNVPALPEKANLIQLRLFSGRVYHGGTIKTDLLSKRIRYTPYNWLEPNLKYQMYLRFELAGINGATLDESIAFYFATGSTTDPNIPVKKPVVKSSTLLQLWKKKGCHDCHSSTQPRSGVDLSTIASTVRSLRGVPSNYNGIARVVPYDHARSYLMYKLLGQGPYVGFQMPPGSPALSPQELRLVADWIDQGASP